MNRHRIARVTRWLMDWEKIFIGYISRADRPGGLA
jgi:hypothetical protein